MSRLIVVALLILYAAVASAAERIGDDKLFGYNYWLPEKVYTTFHYNDSGQLDGFRVAFKAGNGRLFKEWSVIDDYGDHYRFPFVMEISLVADKSFKLKYSGYDGHWGFGRLDGNNEDTPLAYRDSDFLDYGKERKFGIGIMDPAKLQSGQIYDFWVRFKPVSIKNESDVKVRFRLNVDVSALKRLGFSIFGSKFKLGDGWLAGYAIAFNNKVYPPRIVGSRYSFAIESFNDDANSVLSDYIADINMKGAYCKSLTERVAHAVSGIEACFSDVAHSVATSRPNNIPWTDWEVVSSATYDSTGNHTPTPQPPTPQPPTPQPTLNLTQDTDILVGGIERKAERGDTLRAGEVVTVRTTICATGGNTADARHKSGAKTDTHFAVRLPGTDWQTFAREETKDANLTKGKCHAEKATYTVPHAVGQTIAFRATIDARDEITETNENDNTSRDEVFTILEPPYVDLVGHSLAFVQAPTYAGDHARIRAAVSNNGTGTPHSGIRSVYSVQCPGTGWITLTDDGTDAQQLTPGATAWEETVRPVTMPHATGRCTLRWCVDSANAVAERNEGNNCTTQTFTLHPRPAPDLAIEWASDKKGCCTTKRKKKFYPRAGIANYGNAAPTTTVEVRYFLRGPGTGNNWWDMGNVDHLPPHELTPGARRSEGIGRGWRVPKHFAKGWHEIRVCINANPWGSGHAIAETTYGNNCKSYWRYVK